MSFKSRALAMKAARNARALLNHPKGWVPSVFENGGYHWALYNGPFSLRRNDTDGNFWCMVADHMDQRGSGGMHWHNHFQHLNPNKAIAHERDAARAVLADMAKLDAFLATIKT